MEIKLGMELDSVRHVDVDLKRKREAQSNAFIKEATDLWLPTGSPPNTSTENLGKRRKLHEVQSKSGCGAFHHNKSVLQRYLNLKRSGPLERLMYYQNEQWIDFPEHILAMVKADFWMKKSVIEVDFDGKFCILDFVSVMLVDLKTGFQQPIAWIDESGKCFYPETLSDCDEADTCYDGKSVNNHVEVDFDSLGSNNIKLKIDIEINGTNISKPEESSGESNALVKLVTDDLEPEVQDSGTKNGYYHIGSSAAKVSGVSDDNKMSEAKAPMPCFTRGFLESDSVKRMFLSGIKPSSYVNIIDVYRGSSTFMETRLELFQKQAEIVKKLHGDANIRFAWLPSSKSDLYKIMRYGLGSCDPTKLKSPYRYGVHLVAVNQTEISANYCDVDESGVRHMILCRVIMGNTEPVHFGSTQFHPSSDAFDSGVDDCQNPKHYLVWSMNMNTHIYPEYVVSFKFSSAAEGGMVQSENLNAISGVSTAYQSDKVRSDSSPADPANNSRQISPRNPQDNVTRVPKSPWMPFPLLFGAIAEDVDPKKMETINRSYDLFKSKEISREDFVRKLRLTAGDALLRKAILSLQRSGHPIKIVPKPEPGNVGF